MCAYPYVSVNNRGMVRLDKGSAGLDMDATK